MQNKLYDMTEKSINKILDEGIQTTNLEHLYKLAKINDIARRENMNYGNYRNYEHDTYNNYGARQRDARGRFRGHDYLDRMYDNYSRYSEGREAYNHGNYGAKEDTLRSLEYMLECTEDFVKMLKSEANSQEEMELIRKYTKRISDL